MTLMPAQFLCSNNAAALYAQRRWQRCKPVSLMGRPASRRRQHGAEVPSLTGVVTYHRRCSRMDPHTGMQCDCSD